MEHNIHTNTIQRQIVLGLNIYRSNYYITPLAVTIFRQICDLHSTCQLVNLVIYGNSAFRYDRQSHIRHCGTTHTILFGITVHSSALRSAFRYKSFFRRQSKFRQSGVRHSGMSTRGQAGEVRLLSNGQFGRRGVQAVISTYRWAGEAGWRARWSDIR